MKKQIPTLQTHFQALENMTDNIGILQHESNPKYGYSIDDQARALIALSRFSEQYPNIRLANIYLDFIKNSQRKDKHFNNYTDSNNKWITTWKGKKQTIDNFQDCDGRSIWALSEFLSSAYPKELKQKAEKLLFKSLKIAPKLTYPHSIAFTIIGLSKYLQNKNNNQIREINSDLIKKLVTYKKSSESWMTYCVARIPQALFLAGKIKQGKKCLNKIIEDCFDENGIFHATQNPNGGEQPVEAGTTEEALVTAYNITKDDKYKPYINKTFNWYEGDNFANKSLLADNGAIYDAINKDKTLNTNCGAESLVVYLMGLSKVINMTSSHT